MKQFLTYKMTTNMKHREYIYVFSYAILYTLFCQQVILDLNNSNIQTCDEDPTKYSVITQLISLSH